VGWDTRATESRAVGPVKNDVTILSWHTPSRFFGCLVFATVAAALYKLGRGCVLFEERMERFQSREGGPAWRAAVRDRELVCTMEPR
jgi:hypothetical protein